MKRIAASFAAVCLILNCFVVQSAWGQTHSSITISSKPATLATVGSPYAYQVKALSNRAADTIHFRLSKAPTGMKIDSLGGAISWSPTSAGFFGVEILAYNQRGDKASQSFSVKVVTFFGTVKGVIKNDSGEAIRGVHVTLVPQSVRAANSDGSPGFSAETDSLGRYTIANVDSGKYFAQAAPPLDMKMSPIAFPRYALVWYLDSPTITGATPIPVSSATPLSINFTLHKFIPPVPAAISGTVKDSSGKPVREATVVVFLPPASPISAALNSDPLGGIISTIGLSEAAFGCFPFVSSTARTDSSGHYKLQIIAGGPYVVAAFAKNFQLQYYKGKNNALEADRLTLTKDSAGVNFNLSAVPKITTKVSGSVHDSAGTGIISKVVLYSILRAPSPLPQNLARTVHTDSLGHFIFEGIPDGAYILQVVPFSGYLPSFYKVNSCGVLDSRKMDTIFVKGSDIINISVCVKKGNVHGGGRITGKISSSGNLPIAGVVAVSQSKLFADVRSYAVSDAHGIYDISDLDAGTYDVSIDKVGFGSIPSVTKVLDFQQGVFLAQADFLLDHLSPTIVGGDDATMAVGFSLHQNYPNPFNPSTEIVFELAKPAYTTLKVYNMLGQQVRVLVSENLSAGVHTVQFSSVGYGVQELPTGVYIYQLRSGSFSSANKMVLMK